MRFRLALVGFGRVAQGFAKTLIEKRADLKRQFGFDYEVVAVADTIKGSVLSARGLRLPRLLSLVQEKDSIRDYSGGRRDLLPNEVIAQTDANVLVETTWTNLEDGQPGLGYMREALAKGLHVVTTNKGPIALAYHELATLARQRLQ
jgi:homoserine dehydrogenase